MEAKATAREAKATAPRAKAAAPRAAGPRADTATQRVSHRDALLEGAIECLATKGYARTTARDLVAASDTNLASIGYHFGSKEELLNEAIHESFRRWMDPLMETLAGQDHRGALDRLEEGFTMVIASLPENRLVVVALFEALAQVERSEKLRGQLASSYEDFRRSLGDTVADALGFGPEEKERHAEMLSSVMIAAFDGLVIQWLLDPRRLPQWQQLWDATMAVLRSQLRQIPGRVLRAPAAAASRTAPKRRARRPR